MKNIFIMKTRNIVISVLIMLLNIVGVTLSSARVYEAGERLYINMRAKSVIETEGFSGGWYATTSNHNRAYFFREGSSDNWWSGEVIKYKDDVYYVEVPAGNWDRVILTRHSDGGYGWGNVWNQTGNIVLDAEKNYIQNFYYDDYGSKNGAYWQIIAPAPSGNPATWPMSYEDEQICSSAAGTSYTLAPKGYNYDNSKCHAWFKYNSGTGNWDRFFGGDNNEFRSSEGYQDETTTLGAANSDTYYFYQAAKPSACRLVRVRLNQNCEEGAAGACKITNFAAVASDANVTDKTCSVDGQVAFDDKKNAGDLMIWCDDVDTVIIPNASIEIPQTFKLKGFDASSEKTYTLHAKFLEDATETCISACDVTVAPPATTVVTHTTTNSSGDDLSLTRFIGENITLYPEETSSSGFMWINSENDDRVTSEETSERNITFTSSTPKEVIYTYIATNDPVIGEPNLISVGGSFENNSGFTSKYTYWEKSPGVKDPENYYDSHPGASGGYAICSRSTKFSNRYNEVLPHEGSYFGLFDSEVTDGTDQYAWRVSGLSVQSGTSYLFSFWVANINNYGEMNNGARLRFQISYDNGSTFTDLGTEINLSNYRDNRWHGISAIVTPPSSVDNNVIIQVVNKNKSSINRGNDFGLDAIRFEAITTRSSNVAAYEVFPVKFVECEITGATFEQKQAGSCGAKTADVDYTVYYQNPRGNLFIYEGTTKLAEIANSSLVGETSYSGTIASRPLDGEIHTYTVYFEDGTSNPGHKTEAPDDYSYTAYVTPEISIKKLTWSEVTCDNPTCSLTAEIYYINQNGTLSANVDGGTAVTEITYNIEKQIKDSVEIVIPNIPADGKTGHKLNVSFGGSGCKIENYAIPDAAPYSPQITSTTYEIQDYKCGDENYKVKITVNFTNGQGKDLTITDGTHTKVLKPAADASSASWTFDMSWNDPVKDYTFKAYFDGKDECKDLAAHKTTFTSPVRPYLNVEKVEIVQPACNSDKYGIAVKYSYRAFKGTTITYKIGSTVIGSETVSNPTGSVDKTITHEALLCDGGRHEFSFATDDNHDCPHSVTLTAPRSNTLNTFTLETLPVDCDATKYTLRANWKVSKPEAGVYDTLIIKENGVVIYKDSVKAASGNKILGTDYSIGAAYKTYTAYLQERASCGSLTADYDDPIVSDLTIGTRTIEDTTCNSATYSVKWSIPYVNQRGTMKAWLDDDDTKLGTVTGFVENTSSTATVKFTGLKADGSDHVLHVKCTGERSCERESATFTAPIRPVLANVSKSVSTPAFGEITYDVTISADLSNAKGRKLYIKSLDLSLSWDTTLQVVDEAHISHTFKGITTDNDVEHKFRIYFEALPHCGEMVTYNSPDARKLNSMTVGSPSAVSCDGYFTIPFTVQAAEINGTLVVKDGSTTVYSASHDTRSPNSREITGTTDPITADGAEHKLEAYFESQTYQRGDTFEIFDAPAAPTISAASPTASYTTDCEGNVTYTFTINFANQTTDLKLDTAGVNLETYDYATKLAGKSSQEHSLTIPADYKARTVVAYFEGREDAGCKVTINLPAVKKPEWQFKHGVSAHDCNGKYNDTITITYNDAVAGDLKITKPGETTVIESADKSDGTHTYIVKDLDVDFTGNILRYYFGERTDCAKEITATPPTKRSISAAHKNFSTVTCDGKVNDTIVFTITNPIGNFVITKTNGDLIYTEENVGETFTYALTDLTAGGTAEIKYHLSEGLNCELPYSQALPPAPTISLAMAGHDPVDCDGNVILHLDVTFANQTGDLIIEDNAGNKIATIAHDDLDSSTKHRYDWKYPADNDNTRTAVAYFSDRATCLSNVINADVVRKGLWSYTRHPSAPDCGGNYTDTLFFVWNDDMTGNLVIQTLAGDAVHTEPHASLGYKYISSLLNVSTDIDPLIKVHFSSQSGCDSIIPQVAPALPTMTITDKQSVVSCDGTYNDTIYFAMTNQQGDLIIKDENNTILHTEPNVGATYTYVWKDLAAGGANHTVKASLSKGWNCEKTLNLPAPALPAINMLAQTASAPDCNGTVHLPLQVTFANQTAALVVRDNAGNVIDSIPAASVGASPRTITWSYPADENSATLKAYAYFSDRPECATPMVDAEAKLAQSWGYTSHYSPIACDGSYADTLRFTWSHASSDLYIDSIGDPKRYTGSGESGTKTLILHGNVTDAPKDVYKVYFAANAGICDSIIRTIVPQASVLTGFSANVPEVSCGATEYTINATWTCAKAVDSLYIAEEGVGIIWRDSAKAAQPAIITRPLDLDNPGKAHQLYAYFRDKGTACKSEVVTTHEPIVPSFKVTRMEYTRPSCGADKDTLLVDLQYIRQEGTMQVWVDGGSKQTFSGITKSDAAQQQNNIRIEDVPADGLTHTLHVTFTTGCTTFETETPIAPVTPNMTIGSEEITAATGCADITYTLVVPVTYTNQRGDMWAWIDSDTQKHQITATEKSGTGEDYAAEAAERTTYIEFAGLVADGKQHTIHIACDETQDACAKTNTYDAPFTPVIDSVVVSCNEPAFGATTYDATVKVYYKNASKNGTASSLTIRSTDLGAGQSQRSTTVTVSGDGVYTWEVTGLTAEKGATRHFEAFFVDRDTCVFNEEVQTPDTRKLIFSVTPSVVNCDGKDTILFTVNASDLSGKLVVMEGATELYNQPAPTAYPYNGKIETLVDAGTSHTLTAYFTSDEDLTVTKDFTAPAAPTIKMTKADTYNVDCGGEVTVELTIEYENQTGGLEVHDNTGAEIYRKAHNELPASPITFNWTYPADGDTYTATAYFTDRPQCPVAVTADVVSEPYRTHAHHTSAPDCDGYYNDTIRFKWGGNDAGTFVIDSINGTTVRTFTDVSGTFDKILRGHVTDIPSDRYVIYYAGQDCQATVQNNVPKASVLTAFTQDTAYAAGCDATTYALEVSWEYTLAEDELLIVDAATNDVIWQHKATDLPTSATITGLPFDATVAGKEHTLYAYFRDRGEACKREVTYKEPEKPALSITGEVSFSGQSCTGETVDISFPLTYTQQNGTVEAWIDGMDPVTVGSAQNETWTPATEQFTLYAVPADGRTTDLHVRINGTTGCIADKSGVVIPQQPIIRTITTDQPKAFVSCGEAYDVTVSVTFEHGNGKYICVKYTDEGTNHVVQTSSAVTDGTPALITLSGLKDAGATNRSISVYFIDYENCAIDTAAYSLPALNSITAVTVQPGASACGELDYSVSGHVEFNNADGELIVKYDDSHVATISNQTATSADFIIENMNAEGTDMQLTAYFSNAPTCAVQSETFDAPSVPTLSAEILVVDTVFACSDKRYDVTISIAADNQTGDYIVTDSIDGGTARPFTNLTQFSIDRPVASETHIISVRYPATGCEVVIPTPLIVSPLVPAMGEADLAQSQPECGETDYTLSLSFSHTNMNLLPAADRTLVITDNGTELYNDTIPATVAMTFDLPALDDVHIVQITCGLCSATYNYVAPKPYECARYDTLICITEHYAAHGFDITPDRTMTDSLFTRWNGHGTDSLFLTVKEQPAIKLADVSRICDSERELAFPYSVLSGVIDSVQLTLTNAGGADVIADEPIRVTDDTLYYNLSSSLPAGDYLTSVEVFTRGIVCSSSASTPLTIAKDSVIYSKWTDVLLVDNTDGLYTAYQWYENGSPISGQTGQTLYMPEGMTGTYYCRMTTAEGDSIYTCEYVFDEIPRSADHQQTTNHISVKPNRVKAGGMVTVQQSEQETLRLILLSATGQRIAEYTQTESEQVIAMPGLQGIYLLRIASENDAQTVKIVVY